MRLTQLLVVGALLFSGLAFAQEKSDAFKLLHVADLTSLQQQKDARVYVLDANDKEFRQKNGVIPGATLLTSFNKYDVVKELPADKNAALVFYCANAR
jgi:hypothetical protein